MMSALAATTNGAVNAVAATHWVGPWAGGFAPFFLVIPIFWLLVIGLIVFFVTRRRRAYWHANGPYGHWAASSNAESTLAERFAQGDIDEVEYRKRLEVLRVNRQGPGPR